MASGVGGGWPSLAPWCLILPGSVVTQITYVCGTAQVGTSRTWIDRSTPSEKHAYVRILCGCRGTMAVPFA